MIKIDTTLNKIIFELHNLKNPAQAKKLQGFFKTGVGEYGEGDVFFGIKVPVQRKIVKKYWKTLSVAEVLKLLQTNIHEQRLVSLLILVEKFQQGNEKEKEEIFKAYLGNVRYINNWDLVDVTCHKIIGEQLVDKNREILYILAKSNYLWERRIAIISTAAFIRRNDFGDTLRISEILINDQHDLIQKAVGWMLREVGKRDQNAEEEFLKKYYSQMPRTMLRYAIEKFSPKKRNFYLKKTGESV